MCDLELEGSCKERKEIKGEVAQTKERLLNENHPLVFVWKSGRAY